MAYCPKCGNKVDETMIFCPNCGASLKAATPSPEPPKKKGERGFIVFLIGGLVLIVIGLFSLLRFSGYFTGEQGWVIMLLIIGALIISGAVYTVVASRKG